jgi:DNA-binding HxlR family transcriptional regulator
LLAKLLQKLKSVKMSRSDLSKNTCTVARTVELVGDAWTQMVLHELFLGTRRFDVFQKNTGVSPHILSLRLKRMEDDGILERRPYCERPVRHEYRLTRKGRDLWPVIIALKNWGDRWLEPQGAPSITLTHRNCGAITRPHLVCSDCGEPIDAVGTHAEISDHMARERAVTR